MYIMHTYTFYSLFAGVHMKQSFSLTLLAIVLACCGAPPEGASSLEYIGGDDREGSSLAVVVDAGSALAHTTQLFPTDATGALVGGGEVVDQIDQVLNNVRIALAAVGSDGGDLIKLNVYVVSNEVAEQVRRRLAKAFPSSARPAVSYVVSRLPLEGAKVAMDAVAVMNESPGSSVTYRRVDSLFSPFKDTQLSAMPAGGTIYLSGQTQPGDMTTSASDVMKSLHRSLEQYGADPSNIFQIKSFLHPMSDADTVASIIRSFYPEDQVPPLVFVEWVDDSYLSYLSLDPQEELVPIEIEMHAFHPEMADTSDLAVTHHTPPWMTAPPTYSRVAQIHEGDLLYVSGLYGDSTKNAEGQLKEMFAQLGSVLEQSGSSFDHLVKGTYYVTDSASSEALNQIRTEFYEPSTPPTSSKMPVVATGRQGAAVTFDMIGVVPPTPATTNR